MSSFGTLSSSSVAVWLIVTGTCVTGSPAQSIQLHCSAPLQQPLCEALAGSMRQEFPDAAVTKATGQDGEATLTLRYVPQGQTKDWISGYLAWQHRDGRQGQGPVIELSVMDTQMSKDILADFASQLVRHSELPL